MKCPFHRGGAENAEASQRDEERGREERRKEEKLARYSPSLFTSSLCEASAFSAPPRWKDV